MPVSMSEFTGSAVMSAPTHTEVTCKNSSTVLVAANEKRKYLLVVNDSDTVCYLYLGGTAVAGKGIRLNAAGGSFEMSMQYGNLYRGAINCINATGDKTLLVTQA